MNLLKSLCSLKRRLQDTDPTGKTNYTPIAPVQAAVFEKLKGSGHFFRLQGDVADSETEALSCRHIVIGSSDIYYIYYMEYIMTVSATLGEDEHETELQRQNGLTATLQWEAAVENYIILKNMAGL